jgi:hypothetical protein
MLDFAGNHLKDPALLMIAEGMRENGSLSSLDLADTMMGDEAALAFADMIRVHPSLQRFYIGENLITDKAGVAIANALEKNRVLAVLSLANNELRDDTARALVTALNVNTTIVDLDVSFNDFGCHAYVDLSKSLERHRESLNAHAAAIAERHIKWLKDEEARLFLYRAEIEERQKNLDDAKSDLVLRKSELAAAKARIIDQHEKSTVEIGALELERTGVEEQRRQAFMQFDLRKTSLEKRQAEAVGVCQDLLGKRVSLQGVMTKRSAILEEQKRLTERRMRDLRERLKDTRERTLEVVQKVKDMKWFLLDQDEAERAKAAATARAENPPKKSRKRKRSPAKRGASRKGSTMIHDP